LDEAQSYAAFAAILDGECSDAEIAALLTALRLTGESVDELVGAARVMRERVTTIVSSRTGLLDTCGTGGDGLMTFNISTATAIVVAAAGVPVAKHGNRSVSSSSGSADVLEKLGVNINLTPEKIGECIDELGIGFCFAPLLHQAMKHAAPVRRQLKFRTLFNLLGPLTNPARAERQLLGAGDPRIAELLAGALARLGTRLAIIVSGDHGLDEVSLSGPTRVFAVSGGGVSTGEWQPGDFGLPTSPVSCLVVANAAESADVIQRVLNGETGPAREIVLANAAAALIAAESQPGTTFSNTQSLRSAVGRAADAVDSGAAARLLGRLAEWTSAAG
jgi:anthranilate phosphoribosyltransferase